MWESKRNCKLKFYSEKSNVSFSLFICQAILKLHTFRRISLKLHLQKNVGRFSVMQLTLSLKNLSVITPSEVHQIEATLVKQQKYKGQKIYTAVPITAPFLFLELIKCTLSTYGRWEMLKSL